MLLHMQQAPDTDTDIDPEAQAKQAAIERLLDRGGLIDITTTGRRSGEPRRLEIVFHRIDRRLIITGSPRPQPRAWILNLETDPRITIHLKGTVEADLPGIARIITDSADRRAVAEWVVANAWPRQDVEAMTADSPMIEVTLDESPPA
jgi:deazaflavin-dependent oxidoreductase (nitroreductase family)